MEPLFLAQREGFEPSDTFLHHTISKCPSPPNLCKKGVKLHKNPRFGDFRLNYAKQRCEKMGSIMRYGEEILGNRYNFIISLLQNNTFFHFADAA